VYQGIQQNDIAKVLNLDWYCDIGYNFRQNHTSYRKKITRIIIITRIINKYNYVEIEKVRNVTCGCTINCFS
jgi:hypothetical protein